MIFQVRKCVRFLLGNLHDFVPTDQQVDYSQLCPQDKYMLNLLHDFISNVSFLSFLALLKYVAWHPNNWTTCLQVTEAYEAYNYSKVLQLTEKFINTHVSSFHCHVTKDRYVQYLL